MGLTKNKVTIKTPGSRCNITAMKYISDSFHISKNKKYKLPPSDGGDANYDRWLEFTCERHGSSEVADKFNKYSGNNKGTHTHTYAGNHGSGKPKKLNFFFQVTLFLTCDDTPCEVDLYLGQGHHGSTNNWWMGGEQVSRNKGATLSVSGKDSRKAFAIKLLGGNDYFSLTLL